MNRTTYTIIGLIAVSALTGLVGCSTSTTKQPAPTAKPVTAQRSAMQATSSDPSGAFNNTGGTTTCCGSYTGYAFITNSATGTVWFTPPAGTTNCIATDSSGLSSPYVSVVKAIRSDSLSWCDTNSVSFPATSSKKYKFIIYLKNTPPPPTNGQVLTLNVQWQ